MLACGFFSKPKLSAGGPWESPIWRHTRRSWVTLLAPLFQHPIPLLFLLHHHSRTAACSQTLLSVSSTSPHLYLAFKFDTILDTCPPSARHNRAHRTKIWRPLHSPPRSSLCTAKRHQPPTYQPPALREPIIGTVGDVACGSDGRGSCASQQYGRPLSQCVTTSICCTVESS